MVAVSQWENAHSGPCEKSVFYRLEELSTRTHAHFAPRQFFSFSILSHAVMDTSPLVVRQMVSVINPLNILPQKKKHTR